MYNSQEIANLIKKTAQEKQIQLKTMLADCGLGINLISQLANGQAITYLNLAKIADYLDCSVDYLLGRADTTNEINSHNTIRGNNNIIGNGNNIGEKPSEQETALLDIFKKLDVIRKAQLLAYAAELEKQG